MVTTLKEKKDAFAVLKDTLNRFGLGSLSDWTWEQITQDIPETQIFLDLRERPEYQLRFPGMKARQAAGLRAMNESEYLQAEEAYKGILRNAGADVTRYNQPKDFQDYFAKDLSVDEVGERAEIWRTLAKSPQTVNRVKGLFQRFTGMGNVTNEQLFDVLVRSDSEMLTQLNTSMNLSQGVETTSLGNLKEQIQKALKTEAATWAGGGGQAAQEGKVRTGLTSSRTERFT